MMEYPEDPRSAREPSGPEPPSPPNYPEGTRPAGEAEAWLRRELSFLHAIERRILRRERWCREAWRVATVAFILAAFACCWYLAALGSDDAMNGGCPSKSTTTVTGAVHAVKSTAEKVAKAVGSGGSCRA